MPTQEENLKLLWSIISQIAPDGKLDVDWKKTADDLGVESAGAASKRWSRLKTLLAKGDFGGGPVRGSSGATASAESPQKTKAPVTKKEKDKPVAKKRKAEKVEDNEEGIENETDE